MIIRTASLTAAAAMCGLLMLFSSSCMERFQKKAATGDHAGETAAEHAAHDEGAEGHAEHGEGHEGETEEEHAAHEGEGK